MTLGERIKTLRQINKMTLRDLSNKVDISVSFLSDIENGRSNPSLERLNDIAKALDTTVSHLMGEDESVRDPELDHSQQLDKRLRELLSDPEMLVAFKGLEDMTDEEKEGLITYLEAMKARRERKGK